MRGYQKQWRLLRSVPKSLWFCLHYLPLRQAVRLPILVSHRTMLQGMGGTVTLAGPVRPGMVRIGFGWLPTADWKARGSWSVYGDVVFEGTALIVHGVKIAVTGRLIFGDDVFVNADTSIEAVTTVTIGAGSIIAWENVISDYDGHHIDDRPPRAPITLGARVWTGGRVMVLKGVTLAEGTIVGAGSCVTRSVEEPATIVAGSPARRVRAEAHWHT